MKKDYFEIPNALRDVKSYYKIRDTWGTMISTWIDGLFFTVKHAYLARGLSNQQSIPLLALSKHIQWQRRTRRLIDVGMKHLGSMDPHLGNDLTHQNANLTDFFRLSIVDLTRKCIEARIPMWRIRLAYFPARPRQ